jgi:UDP-arabinose 4-epimerase
VSEAQTVLVTGGAGYIGSHACKALARCGFLPVAYDNLVYGHEWAVKWGPLERGDVSDRERLKAVLERYRPVAVMHFAAFAYVGESVAQPGKYYRNNVAGTLTLLETMLECEVANIVFSSTCATYGIPTVLPLPEDHPQEPINPYGASKLMVERILRDFGSAHDLRWLALRYFNAAGADPEGEIGEDHTPETHLIPLVLAAARGDRPSVDIYGTDYPTPDGTAIRDYVHVTDLAEAHILGLRYLLGGGRSTALNLGVGQGHSVREIVAATEGVTGLKVPIHEAPRRPGDPPVLVAGAGRAGALLGWSPRFTLLDDIIATAWKWTLGSRPG